MIPWQCECAAALRGDRPPIFSICPYCATGISVYVLGWPILPSSTVLVLDGGRSGHAVGIESSLMSEYSTA